MSIPLAIDLFCGLGGWTEGLLEHGYDVVGFDIERRPYPAQLVLQNVLTLDGAQFKDAALIVASPPCQQYSWLAMPWSRSKDPNNSKAAKALRKKWETEGPDNRLFDACFRIQRESCDAAGRYIPMVVENVRGAQEWVGPSKANFGPFHFWGDIGMVGGRIVAGNGVPAFGAERMGGLAAGKVPGTGGGWFGDYKTREGRGLSKISGNSSKSPARKAASAQIAKIPFPVSSFVAKAFRPVTL